jgi:hypothetical protein
MAVLSFFHNSVDGDRKYESDDFAKHTSTIIADGVIEGLKVTYTSAYAYLIDVGKAIVMGRSVINDAQIATSIGTPVNGDLYSVVVRMDLVARSASIETILGTTYQNDNAIKQIPLATILVGTNTLTITDKRDYAYFKSNKVRLQNSKLRYVNDLGSAYEAISFKEGSDSTGVGMAVTAGGTTVIGGGESAYDILNNATLVPDTITEKLILSSDYNIEIMTGMQDVKTNSTTGKRFIFNSNGDLNIGGSNADLQTCTIRYTAASKLLQIFHWTGSAVSDTVILEVGDIAFQNTPWINLPLASGISDWTANNNARYKRKGGVLYLNGAVKGITTIGKVIGTLPSGYRPLQSHSFANPTSGKNFARWVIDTDGTITLENVSQVAAPASGDWFPIHTCFPVD